MGATLIVGLIVLGPTVLVRVDNLAGISQEYLAIAEDRAAQVFAGIGVRLAWIDEETAFRQHVRPPFTVVLIKSSHVPAEAGLVEALGFAMPAVGRAHVMYDRIDALTARSPRSAASILGDVIAHELGHLMLPLPKHSRQGIMRPNVDVQVRPLETFTTAEARQILARLARD